MLLPAINRVNNIEKVKHLTTNEERFLEILEGNKKLIFKIANAYCRDREDRKDLMQEIALQLWRAFPKYDPQYALSTWIYRIALNVSISFYRKERKRKQKLDSGYEAILEWTAEEDEEEIMAGEIRFLHQFIAKLNPLDRALMILYLEENKQEDIAHILGISKTNVATKIYRIKKRLEKEFKRSKK